MGIGYLTAGTRMPLVLSKKSMTFNHLGITGKKLANFQDREKAQIYYTMKQTQDK